MTSSPERDTPKTPEVVAHSFSELHDLLTRPRAAGEPLLVRLEGPAAAQILGEVAAVRVAVTGGEVVAR
ncbi:hypothetical protein [Mycobacteroides abscessus]|uniref:hypothetical protein n=1 Tax=Mycobacteroides abscessus TaxID=36809 RepID=UPI0011C37327|nr:hypothetical protein [Mycobacteroides abscessus]